jgi:predicted AAA+ superfamily ATPase
MLAWKKKREYKALHGLPPRALSLEGPRQAGKTFLAKKFASENYSDCVYINLTDSKALAKYIEICETDPPLWGKQLFEKIFTAFNPNFIDASSTLVVIDEIQESYYVYNMIRSMLDSCAFHLLISGSYLGMIAGERNFFTPIGNLDKLAVMPVTFQEYLKAIGEHERYMGLDLFGKSQKSDYNAIHKAYEVYIRVGGFPEVLSNYLEDVFSETFDDGITSGLDGFGFSEIAEMHLSIHDNVIEECKKYIQNSADFEVFKEQCKRVPKTLLDEKRGMSLDFRTVYKSGKKEMDYNDVNSVLLNLKNCGLLNYCNWAEGCDLRKLSSLPMRLYYNDIGMASSLLMEENPDQAAGVIAENFVYLSLNGIDKRNTTIMHNYPAFGTFEVDNPVIFEDGSATEKSDEFKDPALHEYVDEPSIGKKLIGEIDFLHRSKTTGKTAAVEVKKGGKSSKSAKYLLEKGIVDYVLYVRDGENVKGGISSDGKIITIPIYLIDRFDFDKDYQKQAASKPAT